MNNQVFQKIISSKGLQSIMFVTVLILFETYLLNEKLLEQLSYTFLVAASMFAGSIVYFRDQVKRLIWNYRKGTLEFELTEFKEDVVNALVIKQKLLEISSGRWDGPPQKLRLIL